MRPNSPLDALTIKYSAYLPASPIDINPGLCKTKGSRFACSGLYGGANDTVP
jgi:hypothetical protein